LYRDHKKIKIVRRLLCCFLLVLVDNTVGTQITVPANQFVEIRT
jgi:hypothetical protein